MENARLKDFEIIRQPVITEKSSFVGGDGHTVTFEVDQRATKNDVRGAVERLFGVNVISVRTLRQLGKLKRRGREVGLTGDTKKAYVRLKEGQTIDIVEGI